MLKNLFPEKKDEEILDHIVFKGTPSQFFEKAIRDMEDEEEQIAKENFIHKGGGNDPETAKEDSPDV